MAHFAKVVDGKVSQVIVAEPEFFETFIDSSPGEWIQTSYNTYGGILLEDKGVMEILKQMHQQIQAMEVWVHIQLVPLLMVAPV